MLIQQKQIQIKIFVAENIESIISKQLQVTDYIDEKAVSYTHLDVYKRQLYY